MIEKSSHKFYNYKLSYIYNWMHVEDSFLQIQSHIVSTAPVSHDWWEKRHQELSLRFSETLFQRRAVAMSPPVLNKYFDLLE